MHNFTSKKFCYFKFLLFIFLSFSARAQVCGTPGVDGPITISSAVNTYYPVLSSTLTLNAGAQSIELAAVPATDIYGNNFGALSIATGDLILIIQMQDAEINYTNTTNYGSGLPDPNRGFLEATGFTNIGNTGIFEYVIATNNVPISGGNLTFKGTGTLAGVKNSFYNAAPTTTRGKRTFQIVRVPQYSNLTLNANITAPPFNGSSGGVIAFNVSGTFNFANYTIDGNARGFRGGFSPKADSDLNNSIIYTGNSSSTVISGKGEGIAGTPKRMWDGYNEVVNAVEGLPGGSSGRGAPANGGGGGNDHNAGGGGGGNGGYGGIGGLGWQGGKGDTSPKTGGGRPGSTTYIPTKTPPLDRLIMGGGGGGGDANNATSGVKGGVGGAIILINAGSLAGIGRIEANGGIGAAGKYANSPDGAGGGGAGGSVFLNISNPSTATITIDAKGGNGGNTEKDGGNEHGPGGGGGGGIVRYNASGATITSNINAGLAGKTNNGVNPTSTHGAMDGAAGYSATFAAGDLAENLQINSDCFPVLETKVKALTQSVCNSVNNEVSYEIQIKNIGSGNAAKVFLDFAFPTGVDFLSATAVYSIEATGPAGLLSHTNTANKPLIGDFNIAKDGIVTITLKGKITSFATTGVNNANAQAIYLDPTRTTANANRQITAFTYSFGSYAKIYEGGSQANVPGINFNGSSSNIDNVEILALPVAPTVTTTQPNCTTSTGTIKVTAPVNGSGIMYALTGLAPVVAAVSNSTGQFSGLVAGTYQVTTSNANSCTSLPTSTITINSVSGAPTTTSVSICVGGSGNLIASGCTDNSKIEWFTTATGGSSIFTGATFNPIGVSGSGLTNANTAGTTTFYASCNGSTCRAATNFAINPIPTINAVTPGTICGAGSVTLSATASSGTISWYDIATGGTPIATGTTYTTPSLSVTKTYYVQASDNNCTSARTSVTATVTAIPTITSTTGAEGCGPGTLTLKATASAGTVNWYANALGGTSLYEGTEYITPNLSATTTYYVDATNNSCTSGSRLAVAATVNTVSTLTLTTGSQNQTICTGAAITNTVYTFAGSATNAVVTNLPAGLTSNVDTTNKTVTISGTPTVAGTYTITTNGHVGSCTAATLSGKITLTATNAVGVASSTPTLCINTALTAITHTTTGATGIGTATGLPTGVTAVWASNTITISGTPTASGTFNYSIPLTGGCGAVKSATGTITVNADNTVGNASATPTLCINTALTAITHTTTGATGIGTATGLPTGVTAVWASNTITISGTPTASGTFNYSIPLVGGCGAVKSATGTITVNADNIVGNASATPTLCINTALTAITHTTTGATGIDTATGLPTGVTAVWASNTITISGTPTASGTFNYSIPLTGGCGAVKSATGTITVNADNTVGNASATPTLCINTALTAITHTTTGATGIGTATGLPTGVTAVWASDTITISGTPTASGTFNYSIPLTGGCGAVKSATGTITVNADNTVGNASATPTLCINTALTAITHTTTGATGIGTATGLPTGVTAVWASNTITISGTPTASGTFNYSIPLVGGCGAVKSATGTITVNADNTVGNASATPTLCINTALTAITHTTTGATGIGTATGLPTGVTAVWASNTITISGTPTASGTFNYSIPLVGGCGAVKSATGTITVNADNTVGNASATPTLCINTALTAITHTTTGATGIGTATGLPTGVTAVWASDTITISGTPTASGTFNYSIPLTGGCGAVKSATGTITVNADNTVGNASATPTLCINTALTAITHTTTGATGIGTATGLPTGVTAVWASNTITISGTPTASGTFNYSIPLVGGCGAVKSATGTITVNADNTVGNASATPTLCINTALTAITHTTTGATGIGTATGLPTGVTAVWASNTITISGTPTASGTFNYSIPLVGGCGAVKSATGTITVNADNIVGNASATPTLCINTALTAITHTTTGATGIDTATGLPTGVTAVWASNTITISGTPTASGTFNYSIPLTGGCGAVKSATGTITVNADNTVGNASATPTLCINTALTAITHTTTGATGIGTATGLPTGVTAVWASDTITISGTPTASGTFNYSIPLTGGCGAVKSATGTITVNADNTVGNASATPTLCINTALTAITHTTTGATGIGTATGLPTGVTAVWASNTITISGTPTASGTFNYSIPLVGGCGAVKSATGTITVNADNTVGNASATPTLCINTALTAITHTTTGATGIGTATGLPTGVTAVWASNTITISGTPTASGTFNYSIPLVGGCGAVKSATGTITVNADNTVGNASATPTLCINTALTAITHTTTGATGIGTATGLPTGVTAVWASDTITISGTPTASGTFNYSIPLTGGCGAVKSATGTITVNADNTVGNASATPTLCINTALTAITHTTTGATGIGTATGLPTGVTAVWASNTITISGTPTASGTFNYSIPLVGGCGAVKSATGTITVNADNTVGNASATPTLCINTALTAITHTTTGATGIGTATGLPTGVTAVWASNTITISGTPTASGTFNYSIPLVGGCGAVKSATGTITVNADNTVGNASATPTLCINTALTAITHTTTGATGIGTATGLPTGVTAVWASNTITISGTPTASGTFNYSIPLTGGCGNVVVKGNIIVTSSPITPSIGLITQPTCGITTGSIELSGLPFGNWNITAIPATPGLTGLTGSVGTTTIGGLTAGQTYQFRVLNDLGCISNLSTAVLINNGICANDDTPAAINGKDGGNTTTSVLDNDTLNGQPVVASEVDLTPKGAYPNGIKLNPNGTITVDANTPAGNYTVEYTICEKLNPSNCSSATVTVVVQAAVIKANDDTPAAINGKDGGNTTTSVLDNDTLNGQPVVASEVDLTPKGVYPTGIKLNPNGTITVDANTPAGNYTVEYTICEKLNPSNCSSASVTVVVQAAVIKANDDTPAAINGKDGGTTPSVLDNDTLNGQPVIPSEVDLTPKGVYPNGIKLNPSGTIAVDANTPAGNYTVEYTICEKLNPSNCSSATVTVVVQAVVIKANDDTPAAINGKDGGNTTTSVLDNDTLNGQPVVASEVDLTPKGAYPTGIKLNPNGTITVDANTPAGNYTVEYTICEKLNPSNCSSATVTVVVQAAVIKANDDTPAAINGKDGGNTTTSVLDNDTLNGQPVVASEVDLTPKGVYPTGIKLNPNGTITVDANTPAGNYTVEYTICEKLNPSNCSSASVTVVVQAAVIKANDDTPAAINGKDGGTTPSVLDNDTLNGQPVIPSEVDLTPKGVYPNGIKLNPSGTIAVDANTPAGNYTVEYTICEKLNPSNCSSATVTVVVQAVVIKANDDTPAAINGKDGGNTTTSVLDNDTLNGQPVVASEVDLTPKGAYPTGIKLNPNGTITVDANTPAGNYTVEYTICEKLNPSNCSSATVTVVVQAVVIKANDDTPAAINGKDGGNTTTSVLDNDVLNGQPIIASEVDLTPKGVYPTGIKLNTNGTITVDANTPAGNYTVEYTICEKLNPTNCSTASVTVVVQAAVIKANDDTPAAINGKDGGNITTSVLDNDTLNGQPVVASEVDLTPKGAYPTGIKLNPNATITVDANTPAGNYTVEYTICEKLNPTNCSTASVTVVVQAAVIKANDDTPAAINGKDGGNTTTSVLDNDTLNGQPVVASEVDLTPKGAYPTGIKLNPNGTITVDANTPAGNYTVEYTICEKLNPSNCSSATVTVVVQAVVIKANDDTPAAINGKDGGNTTTSVLDNDTLNGQPVLASEVDLTPKGAYPTGIKLNPNATITVDANTPAGTYNVEYTICEKLNPTNCSTATVIVVVTAAVIKANDDTPAAINGKDGGNTTTSVLDNDTLNGQPVVASEVDLTPKGAYPTGIKLNPNGTITVDANTPAGNYTVEYTICEKLNPSNCSSATVTVVVQAAVIKANDDTPAAINGKDGGNTTTSVLDNDTLNGQPVVASEVDLTPKGVYPTGIKLNPNGTITVDANTPAGNYTVEYTICEKLNPSNCSSASVTVVVQAAVIKANDDTPAAINGKDGGTTPSVLDNDTLNVQPVIPSEVDLTPKGVYPNGIKLNPSGTIAVDANTPAGNYTVEYTICEKLNPSNCSSATVTVVVQAVVIKANDDTPAAINGKDGGNTTTSVLDNDTLNGQPVVASEVDLTPKGAYPTGIKLNPNGTITVDANTPAGNYTVEYTICEKLNPSNCSSATVTVVVQAVVIKANDDTPAAINGKDGGNTTTSVLDNDVLNGQPIIASEVDLTPKGVYPTGIKLNTNGTITVDANTPAGNYTVEYTICEKLNPTNCSTASVTVVVQAAVIKANDDTPAAINGKDGGNITTSVLDNDTLNGQPVVASEVDLTPKGAYPTGIKLNPNATITVDANTPAGNYTVEYTICEKLNPTNCSTASVTVVVQAAVIKANDDTPAAINGKDGGNTTTSVLDNDTLNGQPVVASEVDLTPKGAYPTGIKLNPNGTITVDANTPAGNYTVEYTICEKLNPSNCSSATVTVVVQAVVIKANDDTPAAINGKDGGNTTTSVLDNDTLNGQPVLASEVDLTPKGAYPTGIKLNPNATITVDANTPAGTYNVEYTICEKLNPTNCSTATVIVVVTAAVIKANDDTPAAINGKDGGNTTTSVLDNDTLNGQPVVASEVDLTPKGAYPTGIKLNPNGTITVDANTPAGNYTVEYTICEKLNPSNCSSATVTVVVQAAVIKANDDTPAAINGKDGGTTPSVLDNDKLNGQPIIASEVDLTPKGAYPTGIKLNPNGTITVDANTPAGNYTVEYTICEKLNPSNCSSASVTVVVQAAVIKANDDTPAAINGKDGGTTPSVLDNDTLNGQPVIPSEVDLTPKGVYPNGIKLNPSGTIAVDANTPAGNYTVEYTICEKLNPSNCSSATVTVVVQAVVIKANDDTPAAINGKDGGNTTTSVLDNDTLNGQPVVASEVDLTPKGAYPTGIKLNPNGTITVDANTPAGNYTVEYTICEKLNPSNCSSATVKVTVQAPGINANNDGLVTVDGINGAVAFLNVLSNDNLNGATINPSQITLVSNNIPKGIVLNADGTLDVAPNTAGGTYTFDYQICEIANTTNCATAKVSVFIERPAITLVRTVTFNDENGNGVVDSGETITYSFTVTNTGNTTLQNIQITDSLEGLIILGGPITLGINQIDINSFSANYTITQNDINKGTISSQATVVGFTNSGIQVDDSSDYKDAIKDYPTVLPSQSCVIKIFNALSINGDNTNERFYIQGIECYPDNTVEIYNRWGVLIFEKSNYDNVNVVFKGFSEGRVTIKETGGLPAGTYFYVLKYKDSSLKANQKAGYLYITK
ncbi:gliding motility-associated C-terminal domain-containing protein [Flavobacterium sp. TMP13]|uniref:Ig-like domain-containing protein n=1 Tax=Flavobacterium sp. TMP13 TaxID=3425950 RepID=UPI003D77E4BE